MLQKLNERTKGVVAWIIVILIAITFTLFGVDYYMQSRNTRNNEVAEVNGQPISAQLFENTLRRSRSEQSQGLMSAEQEKNLKKRILDALINNEVAVQGAHQYGFFINSELANQAISQIPQFQDNGQFSVEKYQQALSSALFTPQSFHQEVMQGLLLNQQHFAFTGTAFVLPEELAQFISLYFQKRDYSWLEIPLSRFNSNINVPLDDMKKYYQDHQNDFIKPEQVQVSYVILSGQEIKKDITIQDDEIIQYYDENQNNFVTPAKWTVAQIFVSVPKGATEADLKQAQKKADDISLKLDSSPASFETLLKEKSDDKLSINSGGVLPEITAGTTEFDAALVKLTEKGQISKPFKSQYGYHIFKLMNYTKAQKKSLEQVRDVIKTQLISDKSQSAYANALEELTDIAYQQPDSLEPAAKALNLKVLESTFFDKAGSGQGIESNKAFIKAAFSEDVLNAGNNSETIQIDQDRVAVLRLKQHHPEEVLAFDKVESRIKSAIMHNIEKERAMLFASKFKNSDSKQQEAMLSELKLKWIIIKNSSREDLDNAALNQIAFSIQKTGMISADIPNEQSMTLVKLDAIHPKDPETLDKEQRNSIAQQLEASYGNMDYELYLNSLMTHAKIELLKY